MSAVAGEPPQKARTCCGEERPYVPQKLIHVLLVFQHIRDLIVADGIENNRHVAFVVYSNDHGHNYSKPDSSSLGPLSPPGPKLGLVLCRAEGFKAASGSICFVHFCSRSK